MKIRLLITALLLSWSTSAFAGFISATAFVNSSNDSSLFVVGNDVNFAILYDDYASEYSTVDYDDHTVFALESISMVTPISGVTIAWSAWNLGVLFGIDTGTFLGLAGNATSLTPRLEMDAIGLAVFIMDQYYNDIAMLTFYNGGVGPAGNVDVPEPGTLSLLGLGLVMLGLRRRIART